MGERRYYDPERETLAPHERAARALGRLQVQLRRCRELPFYRRHWDAAGFHPDQVRSWEDFTARCPVIDKRMLVADQQKHPPFGSYQGVERSELARLHSSPGP